MQTQVIAGVTIPDTPLFRTCVEFTAQHTTEATFNHVFRSLLFGFLISARVPTLQNRDIEVHAVAAIMHDLGWDPKGTLPSSDKRFEVDGANITREFIKKSASATEWNQHRLQLVWDAIALHTTWSIASQKEPEVQAVAYGIWADILGPDNLPKPEGVTDDLLTWEEFDAITKLYPRMQFTEGMKEALCALCIKKPEVTYDNPVGEWGEKYVEGYSRVGKLPRDVVMALGQALDDRDYSASVRK